MTFYSSGRSAVTSTTVVRHITSPTAPMMITTAVAVVITSDHVKSTDFGSLSYCQDYNICNTH